MTSPEISNILVGLSEVLNKYRSFWSIHPFAHDVFDWEKIHPGLSDFLRSWTEEEVEVYERTPYLHPKAPKDLITMSQACIQYSQLPRLYDPSFTVPKEQSKYIKGKKWAQLVPFLSTIPNNEVGFIDWCCGKGHLGRLLCMHHTNAVLGIEYNKELVQWGKKNSVHSFHCCNVLSDTIPHLEGTMVALHSCGDLLSTAIHETIRQNLTQCVLVSCCYHKIRTPNYQSLSRLGKHLGLQLSQHDVRIPSTLEHHPSKKIKRRRRKDMLFRVMMDLILRDMGYQDSYRSFPPVPDSWKDSSMRDYVEWVCEREGFPSMHSVDLSLYERRARKKLCMIRGLSSLRSMFARPLEIWINADRALYLHEHGYEVELGTCMPQKASPRNICIRAKKVRYS